MRDDRDAHIELTTLRPYGAPSNRRRPASINIPLLWSFRATGYCSGDASQNGQTPGPNPERVGESNCRNSPGLPSTATLGWFTQPRWGCSSPKEWVRNREMSKRESPPDGRRSLRCTILYTWPSSRGRRSGPSCRRGMVDGPSDLRPPFGVREGPQSTSKRTLPMSSRPLAGSLPTSVKTPVFMGLP